jgi:hypothetical protein
VEAEDEQPVYVVTPMTATPPPDMPGYGRRKPEEVRCTKHGFWTRRVKGKLWCPEGHPVNADGSPKDKGTGSSQRGEHQ